MRPRQHSCVFGTIPGISISGQFLLEMNTYSNAETINSFQTNMEAGNPGDPNTLATDPNTGFFVIGPVTIGPGFSILLEGMLKIGPLIEMEGRFEFTIDPSGLDIKANARMRLFQIGAFDIDAVLRIDQHDAR